MPGPLANINYRDVVFAAHRDPHFAAVGSKERLVRRAAHVNNFLHFVGRGLNERDGIRRDGNHSQCVAVRRIAQAMHQQLAAIERRERPGHGIAQPNHAEKFVRRRINHRDRIGSLVRGVHAVVRGDGDVRASPGSLRFLRECRGQYQEECQCAYELLHIFAPCRLCDYCCWFGCRAGVLVLSCALASCCFSQSCIS
jgi:hypothetical protein